MGLSFSQNNLKLASSGLKEKLKDFIKESSSCYLASDFGFQSPKMMAASQAGEMGRRLKLLPLLLVRVCYFEGRPLQVFVIDQSWVTWLLLVAKEAGNV